MSKRILYIIGILGFLVLVLAIPLTVKLVRERQELRKEAAVPGGTATLSLDGEDSVQIGQSLPVSIKLQTPTTPENKGITGIKVTLFYNFSGTDPFSLEDSDIAGLLPAPWNYARKGVTKTATQTTITIEAVYFQSGETGYLEAVSAPVEFARINFTPTSSGNINLEFDATKSEIRSKDQNLDILGLNLASKTLALGGGTGASPSPSASPSTSPSPSPSTSPSPSPSASPSPSPSTSPSPSPSTSPSPSPSASPSPSPSIFSSTSITTPQAGATVTDTTPTIAGKTLPGATVTITINSPTVTATVTADASGNWSYTPTTTLGDGSHSVSITAQDPGSGQTVTKTSSFLIASAGSQAATDAGQVVAGNFLPTLLLLGLGFVLLILSLAPRFF